VGQEEGSLVPTEEMSESEYGSETKSSAGSVLLAQQLSQPTPPPLISLLLPLPYIMSQPDYPTIIRQLQEQIAVLVVVQETERGDRTAAVATSIEVARP